MIDILGFRNDLWSGMSLCDALTKHETNLHDVFQALQNKPQKPKGSKSKVISSSEPYIFIRNNTFSVRKSTKGKTKMFGTYNSMEDAIRMRDALKRDGWHQTHVDRICEELGIQRRKGFINEKVRYH